MKVELGDLVEHEDQGELIIDDIKEFVVGIEDDEPIKELAIEVFDPDDVRIFSEPEKQHFFWDEFVGGIESVFDQETEIAGKEDS